MGIPGNEEADRAAKEATEFTANNNSTFPSKSLIKTRVEDKINQFWQEDWDKSTKG